MLRQRLPLGPAHQTYLLEARQMQALSFAGHIPLVCLEIAFPAMVLFVEWAVSAAQEVAKAQPVKLAANRVDLTRYAIRRGLVQP